MKSGKSQISKQKKTSQKTEDKQSDPISLPWSVIGWASLIWAVFIVYKCLQKTPLHMVVFESILPTQNFFPSFFILATYFWNLILFLGIVSISFTLGFYFLKMMSVLWMSPLEKSIFSISIGYGLLSIFLLILAGLHVVYKPVLIGLWIFGVGAFVFLLNQEGMKDFLRESMQKCGAAVFGRENLLFVRLFLWAYLLMTFVMALVPDLFYDALVYHLGVPNLYLQEHGLVRIPGATSKFPLLWQTLYMFGLGLTDEMIPKLLHWSSGVLILLGCRTMADRFGLMQNGTKILPGLFFISIPMVQMNIWTCGIDVGSCLFSFLALYCLCGWSETNVLPDRNADLSDAAQKVNPAEEVVSQSSSLGWIILSAVMSGFAFGSKYQGGLIAVSVFFIFFGCHIFSSKRNFRLLIKESLAFGAVFVLIISPWLVKNFWDTGNPLFPFLSPLFKKLNLLSYELELVQWEGLMAENRRFIVKSWTEFWKLPWMFTFNDSNQSSLSYPGPLLLTFLPLSLTSIQYFRRKWFQVLGLFLIVFFAFSLSSTHLTRYHLQGYPVLCFFYALGFSILWGQKNILIKLVLSFSLGIILLENLQTGIYIIQNSYKPWDVLSGRESREDYRLYTHPGLNPYPSNAMYRWMEKNIPRNSRTLIIGESKSFDLKLPYLYTDVHGQNPLIAWCSQSKSPEELNQKFQNAGITHLMVNFKETHRTYGYKMIQWQKEWLATFESFWNDYVREVHREKIPEKYFQSFDVLLLYEVLDKETAKTKGGPPVNPMVILEQENSK